MSKLAKGLGWFSIALGLVEVLAPRRLDRAIGVAGRGGLTRAYGVREIASGVGLLSSRNKRPWLWSRLAGDALDISTLLAAKKRSAQPRRIDAALANVLGVTALDVVAARRARRS